MNRRNSNELLILLAKNQSINQHKLWMETVTAAATAAAATNNQFFYDQLIDQTEKNIKNQSKWLTVWKRKRQIEPTTTDEKKRERKIQLTKRNDHENASYLGSGGGGDDAVAVLEIKM